MKKKLISVCSAVLILVMIAGTPIFAATETFPLSVSQRWNTRATVTRTLKYSYGSARCLSVSPLTGGVDTFLRIQVCIRTPSGTQISNVYKLIETATSSTPVYIYEGSLDITKICFSFRGNDPDYGAMTTVSYTPN